MTKEISVRYTNWRGETRVRQIKPLDVFWGSNEWHTEEQWLLRAIDVERSIVRVFALKDCDFAQTGTTAWLSS